MTNLIPVQRPDKNGKMVTRWVRPQASGSLASSIPAVKPSKSHERKHLEDSIKERLPYYEAYPAVKSEQELLQKLSYLDDRTVSLYSQAIQDETYGGAVTPMLISVLQKVSVISSSYLAESLLAIMKYDPDLDDDWSWQDEAAYSYVSALEMYKGFTEYKWAGTRHLKDLHDESDPETQKALALFNVGYKLLHNDTLKDTKFIKRSDGKAYITDGHLVSLILERPEQADEIADLVTKRGTTDGILIREIMDSAPSTLRSGVL